MGNIDAEPPPLLRVSKGLAFFLAPLGPNDGGMCVLNDSRIAASTDLDLEVQTLAFVVPLDLRHTKSNTSPSKGG